MNQGRKIAESAALLAVFCILVFLCIQMPFIGTILMFVLPLPFILVAAKYNLTWSLSYLAVGTLLTAIIGTPLFAPVAFLFGSTGIAIGYNLRKKYSFSTLYVSSVMIFLFGFVALYVFSIYFLHVNILETSIDLLRDSIEQSTKMLDDMGQSPEKSAIKRFSESLDMLIILAPSLFVITSMIMVILILLAVSPIIKRLRRNGIEWQPISKLRMPRSILWYYLIAMVLSFFIKAEKTDTTYMVIVNVLYVLQTLLLLQGYSFLFFYSRLKGWPKAFSWFIVVLSLLVPIFHYVIRILGIIDLGFKFRETHNKN
ncbi:uncharacterized protein YybS (DUF2232 family) [Peribacillus deserti]|uniref:Uncharacterized protein YybS (DUF2232 family) n=1 Tax=Peribacillus deserti TaxID=673318 RepID=A0ABS2QK47_9BACI|nr:YybS family protein [Peribacillus deserti]MBM7693556.1 uncharacterized protein YybS (DUF2232 family) [Peribacillus deserti]